MFKDSRFYLTVYECLGSHHRIIPMWYPVDSERRTIKSWVVEVGATQIKGV